MISGKCYKEEKKLGKTKIITINKIYERAYNQLIRISDSCFPGKEYGLFGIEEKVLIIPEDCSNEDAVDELSKRVNSRFKKLTRGNKPRFQVECLEDGRGVYCLEIRKGIFRTPMAELRFDRIVKNELEEACYKLGLKPLYAGMDLLNEDRKSYGHHIHWSAGGPLHSLLTYIGMRNELWRVAAFSANSPDIDIYGCVYSMNHRLGNTYVTNICPPKYDLSWGEVEQVSRGISDKNYPLLIDDITGTVEVRASDIDPKSSATVAYITLLLRAIKDEIIKTRKFQLFDYETLNHNMTIAKEHAISNKGKVEVVIDQKKVRMPIQDEMKRHYKEVIEPTLEKMIQKYEKLGRVFIHPDVIDEIHSRIYKGLTPAQKLINTYKKCRRKKMSHRESLVAAQRLNLFNKGNYFKFNS